MLEVDQGMRPDNLAAPLSRLWPLAKQKILALAETHGPGQRTPVFTQGGQYQSQGWTEWTQGFQFGSPLLVFDAVGDERLLELGRRNTTERMAAHVTHIGVHDHGFNNVSTYGNLWRLGSSGRFHAEVGELDFYALALRASGAVQAARWTPTHDAGGYIYSFNGPHSLFSDTIRSLRSLALAHQLHHTLWDENDEQVSLLERLVVHARTTTEFNVYYGSGRDIYDVPGRVAHESIFNVNDGRYRCPSTQQGYSPFSTWTRGLAWIMLGCAEQLEYLASIDPSSLQGLEGGATVEESLMRAAQVTCDYYLAETPTDGVPYWDTGAPGLHLLGDYRDRPAEPDNPHEPVDSSAAAIACQALWRFGHVCLARGSTEQGERYIQAGLCLLRTLLGEPYLSVSPEHQGILLHSVYHRPRGWDSIPQGAATPRGESCLWGDYHLLEAALCVQRSLDKQPYYTFFETGN